MLVVCDDNCRILYQHTGWPGSVHDNRVWRTCKLMCRSDKYFSDKEYLLGDTAFTPGPRMIPPFKQTPGTFLNPNKIAFNTLLASPRVKSEHCIGILKGRFPFLKGIRMTLGGRKDMQRILKYVRGCVILHNFLVDEDVDSEWIEVEIEEEEDRVQETQSSQNTADNTRRSELFFYLSELEDTNII